MIEDFSIDIDKILASQTKVKVPRFIVNYLKKIIHQDEINAFLADPSTRSGLGFFEDTLRFLNIKYEVRGLENLPKEGKYIFAANHPLGGPEAVIFGEVFRQTYGEKFKVPVNAILAHLKPLAEFFVPVNAISAKQSKEVSRNITAMFESDAQVLVFPAGKCARWRKFKITEMPWKKMFVTQARRYNRSIIPVHCTGKNSFRYNFLTFVSEMLKLKFSLGMLYLVDELFKHRNKTFVITFGEVVSVSDGKGMSDKQWAAVLREKAMQLGR